MKTLEGMVIDTTGHYRESDCVGEPVKQLAPSPQPKVKAGRQSLVFDIETGPAPDWELRELSEPFEPVPPPGPFDPTTVRTGNMKDPEKIQTKIAEAREAYEISSRNHAANAAVAEQAYWDDIKSKAPLSPVLGRVLAIGIGEIGGWHSGEHVEILAVGDVEDTDAEADIIDQFWCDWYLPTVQAGYSLIGHFIKGFDLPFLIRRSWLLGVDVPPGVMEAGGKYYGRQFIDTKEIWECGTRGGNGVPGGLDYVARAFGEWKKTEGMTGAGFWKAYHSGDREQMELALEYLRNDVRINARVANRMGLN